MRLAYLCSDPGIAADGVKGASVHFRQMGSALRRAGVDVEAFTVRRPASPFAAFPLRCTPLATDKRGLGLEMALLAHQARLAEVLAGGGRHDAIYERFSLFGLAGLAHARARNLPLLLEVNAPLWEEARRYRDLRLTSTARAMARDVLTAADRVLVVSRHLGAMLEKEGVSRRRIVLFPNGVSDRFLAPAAAPEVPAPLRGRRILVFVGSLKPWHGIPFLLEAFAAAAAQRRLGLWVVGEGPLRGEVERASRRSAAPIVVSGGVDNAEVAAILQTADVAVAPYTADSPSYFCPLKVVEALAAGCPLLAADVPAVREVVGLPATAQLHAPGDVRAFVQALFALLDHPRRRRDLVQRGRQRVQARHRWSQRADEVIDLVGEIAGELAAAEPTSGGKAERTERARPSTRGLAQGSPSS